MGNASNNISEEGFVVNEHIMLLFNEHDIKIVLEWENFTPRNTDLDQEQQQS